MRLSGVLTGDLVIVEEKNAERYLALVELVEGRELVVLPLAAKARKRVSGYYVVGHYRRRRGELATVRTLVARIRIRFGIRPSDAGIEALIDWPAVPA